MSRRRPTRRRASLAARISLLSVAIAVVTALIAAALATGLIRSAGTDSAQQTLARLADVAQSTAGRRTPLEARHRLHHALRGLAVQSGTLTANGSVHGRTALVRQALDPAQRAAVLAGTSVSGRSEVDGVSVLVEARAVDGAGIVLVQPRSDAVAQDDRAIRLLLLALLVAGIVAALIGLLVAYQLARPLRRTARAAHALAAGRRDVDLPAEGPAEIVEVSEAVNSIAGALRVSEARQRQFLLSVSHDLRTPLTAIRGYAESLADDVVSDDDGPRIGRAVLGESLRLQRMVGDLLDLARLDSADLRVDLGVVDVAEIARDAVQVWSARGAAARLDVRLEQPDHPLPAWTDASRLRQLLDGLFDNAERVTPPGSVVVLAVRAEHETVVVEVRDGGPGLSDDDLLVAFDQGVLNQRYRGRRQVGTGLGLAIAHRLATRLRATIEAGHAPEGGARFTIRLPTAPPDGRPEG